MATCASCGRTKIACSICTTEYCPNEGFGYLSLCDSNAGVFTKVCKACAEKILAATGQYTALGIGAAPDAGVDLHIKVAVADALIQSTGADSKATLKIQNDAKYFSWLVDGADSDYYKLIDAGGDRIVIDGFGFKFTSTGNTNITVQSPDGDDWPKYILKHLDISWVLGIYGTSDYFFINDQTNNKYPFKIQPNGIDGSIHIQTGEVVINEGGANLDFRVEGDAVTNLICTDAANDRVGIKDSAPDYDFDVNGVINAVTEYRHNGTQGISQTYQWLDGNGST